MFTVMIASWSRPSVSKTIRPCLMVRRATSSHRNHVRRPEHPKAFFVCRIFGACRSTETIPSQPEPSYRLEPFVARKIVEGPIAGARRYLTACADAGLALRIHGDQFRDIGAIPLAIDLVARSIDHLEATGPTAARQLAVRDVAAVLVPIASLFLRRPYPPSRAMIDNGAIMALATDFNAGSAFSASLPLAMSLAFTQMGMTPSEALVGCTANAAHVLGRGDRLGRLRSVHQADLLLLRVPDWRFLANQNCNDQIALRVNAGQPLDSV
jgi:imidazolonepropionase